jgi:CheY-like chemotaxis protein
VAVRLIPSLATLLIGDFEQPEFRAAAELLVRQGTVRRAARLDSALAECQAVEVFPDLVVLAQSRPGEFDPATLDALRRWAPLARVITVLGSWCAGETRSGTPLAGVVRLYWHEAPDYLAREFERQQHGECPDWGLPITATEFDRFSAADLGSGNRSRRTIAIHSSNPHFADWLARACEAWGYAAAHCEPGSVLAPETTSAAIWDAGCLDGAELQEIQAWAKVPLLVLLDFPHGADQQRALDAGAQIALAKPVRADDLRWHLDQLCESAADPLPR